MPPSPDPWTGRPASLVDVLGRAAALATASYVKVGADGTIEELRVRDLRTCAGQGAAELLGTVGDNPDRTLVPLVVADPLAFVRAFFAVVHAGLVPVPLPGSPHLHARHRHRLRSVLPACAPRVVVTDCPDPTVDKLLRGLGMPVPVLKPPHGGPVRNEITAPDVAHGEIAYVQYTSGSLSDPRPVRLTPANVVAQLDQAARAFEESAECTVVNWVPLHHDMGLVTSVLRPLWSGYRSVLLDPFDFVKDPALWLRELTCWRASHTSAPDFGYELCARKAAGQRGLDLSALRVARTAGEPVRATTLDAFTDAFAPAGFRRSAFNPSYGLAEATLTVTATPVGAGPSEMVVDSDALRRGIVCAAAGGRSTRLVSSGRPLPGTHVAVVDAVGRERPDDEVGEVWISGPQVSPLPNGARPLAGRAGYLTGDLGFLHDGQLYLLGRAKERFQVAGENYYSVEVEAVATAADSRLRPGRGICVLAQVEGAEAPAPTLLLEIRDGVELDEEEARDIVRVVTARVAHEVGLAVRDVGLLSAGSLPRTTSGKLQRDVGKLALESGRMALTYWHRRNGR